MSISTESLLDRMHAKGLRLTHQRRLLAELLDQVLAGGAGMDSSNVEQLLASPSARQPGKTVAEVLRENVAQLGENLALGGFVRVEVAGPTSRLETARATSPGCAW